MRSEASTWCRSRTTGCRETARRGVEMTLSRPLPEPAPPPSLFRSFWMAGYESSCHINPFGRRVDMLAVTQHDRFVREDYRLLQDFQISSVRDAIRWHLVDRGCCYDFSSFTPMFQAAQENGIQVIWDLCHY